MGKKIKRKAEPYLIGHFERFVATYSRDFDRPYFSLCNADDNGRLKEEFQFLDNYPTAHGTFGQFLFEHKDVKDKLLEDLRERKIELKSKSKKGLTGEIDEDFFIDLQGGRETIRKLDNSERIFYFMRDPLNAIHGEIANHTQRMSHTQGHIKISEGLSLANDAMMIIFDYQWRLCNLLKRSNEAFAYFEMPAVGIDIIDRMVEDNQYVIGRTPLECGIKVEKLHKDFFYVKKHALYQFALVIKEKIIPRHDCLMYLHTLSTEAAVARDKLTWAGKQKGRLRAVHSPFPKQLIEKYTAKVQEVASMLGEKISVLEEDVTKKKRPD